MCISCCIWWWQLWTRSWLAIEAPAHSVYPLARLWWKNDRWDCCAFVELLLSKFGLVMDPVHSRQPLVWLVFWFLLWFVWWLSFLRTFAALICSARFCFLSRYCIWATAIHRKRKKIQEFWRCLITAKNSIAIQSAAICGLTFIRWVMLCEWHCVGENWCEWRWVDLILGEWCWASDILNEWCLRKWNWVRHVCVRDICVSDVEWVICAWVTVVEWCWMSEICVNDVDWSDVEWVIWVWMILCEWCWVGDVCVSDIGWVIFVWVIFEWVIFVCVKDVGRRGEGGGGGLQAKKGGRDCVHRKASDDAVAFCGVMRWQLLWLLMAGLSVQPRGLFKTIVDLLRRGIA